MKKSFLTFLFVCFSMLLQSQINEIGFFVGNTNYIGDVGRTNYLYPRDIGGGLIYKWNWNPRIALRGTLSMMNVSADDANADNSFRKNRGYTFENKINEVAVGIEFNFYEYDLSSKDKTWTPYILAEISAFNYSVVNDKINTNPIEYAFTDKTSYSIPFGIGFKSKLAGKLAFAVETRFRYTFTDDIDYTSNRFPELDFGGEGNDWYVFTGLSIVYTFGRPSCYADGF